MLTRGKQAEQGFTIIEVLIVLGIAGLIFSIIFMALPTLSRSSRNNQRRQDIALLLQEVAHFELNNSGAFPSAADPTDAAFFTNIKLNYYDTNTTPINFASGTTGTTPAETDPEHVSIYNRKLCKTDGSGTADDLNAGLRDIVAIYAIESSPSVITSQCMQL